MTTPEVAAMIERLKARRVRDRPGVYDPDELCHEAARQLALLSEQVERLNYVDSQNDLAIKAYCEFQARALAAEAEAEGLREALKQIATDEKIYTGHGDFIEQPLSGDYCQILARAALAAKPHQE